MFLVDSHCHLDKLNYNTLHQDVDDVIGKARMCDVKLILSVCTTLSDFYAMTEMVGQRADVLFSCGIHPLYLDEPYNFSELRHLATYENVIALGETGLDYYHNQNNKIQQKKVFRKHIQIGREQNKPIIVHMRSAREDTLAILREEQARECSGILHCFTEDCATAKALLDMNFYISFSGIVTFRSSNTLCKVARYVPLDRLLVESDSPYLAPIPYRGKENQPAYVYNVAEYVAIQKGISLLNLAIATTSNFSRLFRITIPS